MDYSKWVREINYFETSSVSKLYIIGERSRNPNQSGLEKLFNRRSQVLENTSEIYINKGSDNNQTDISYLEFQQFLEHQTDKREFQ